MNSHGGWYSYAGNVNYFGTDGGGGDYLNGILDEVRISKIARSAGWITTEYRNQNAPGTFYTVGAEQNN
jgi:trimeric autotransporter adhesin